MRRGLTGGVAVAGAGALDLPGTGSRKGAWMPSMAEELDTEVKTVLWRTAGWRR